MKIDIDKFKVKPDSKVKLKDYDTSFTGGMKKKEGKKELKKNIKELADFQRRFWADDRHSLLIILQAPDAAGKDGAIRHVMSGLNPRSCRVNNFKTPSKEELDHDYLWRHYKALPERGMIEIFNRSHYENVLVTKVNPEYLLNERIPGLDSIEKADKVFWNERYKQINNFEKHIFQNGCHILKFYLHLSKEEQKERFLDRINNKNKNWKFNSADLKAREQWDEYQDAYEKMLEKTSTDYAPWYIIPADKKYFSRALIGEIIVEKLKELDLSYPPAESPEELAKAKEILLNE